MRQFCLPICLCTCISIWEADLPPSWTQLYSCSWFLTLPPTFIYFYRIFISFNFLPFQRSRRRVKVKAPSSRLGRRELGCGQLSPASAQWWMVSLNNNNLNDLPFSFPWLNNISRSKSRKPGISAFELPSNFPSQPTVSIMLTQKGRSLRQIWEASYAREQPPLVRILGVGK
jgi:hypothetical protein